MKTPVCPKCKRPLDEDVAPLMLLTKRELDVIGLVASGLGNRLISQKLYLTERTVEAHIGHIMSKWGYLMEGKEGEPKPHQRVKIVLIYLSAAEGLEDKHEHGGVSGSTEIHNPVDDLEGAV